MTNPLHRWARGMAVACLGVILTGVFLTAAAVRADAPPATAPGDSGPGNPGPHASPQAVRRAGGTMLLARLKSTVESLDLSADQKTKIDGFFTTAESDLKTLAGQADLDPQDKRQQAGDIFQDLRQDVGSVLTDAQKQTLRDKMAAFRNARGQSGPGNAATRPTGLRGGPVGPAGPGGPAGFGARGAPGTQFFARLQDNVDQLDLSDQQKIALADLMDKTRQKMAATYKEAQGDRDAMRDEFQGLMADFHDQLLAILTPEQAAQLQEMRQNARPDSSGAVPSPGHFGRGGDAPPSQDN